MSWLQRIRKRDGVIADLIYRLYKSMERVDMPRIPLLYKVLWWERMVRKNVLVRLKPEWMRLIRKNLNTLEPEFFTLLGNQ